MSRSFIEFMTRRELLALAATAAVAPLSAFTQERGAAGQQAPGQGRGARGPAAPVEPLVLPFEATGWKTVWLDHLSYQCTDYKKAAAFYATLMNWKVRSDNGKECMLDIGENSGGILIRGGMTAPPPAAITDVGLGAERPKIQAMFDGFAWGIENFDEKKVKAELEKRGLKPVADNHGDFKSFHIKDPDGFNVWITNGTKANRRNKPANAKLPAPAPFAPTGWTTLFLDHLSFEMYDFRRSAAFYQALLGWNCRPGNGQVSVDIGTISGAIIRGNAAYRAATRGGVAAPPGPPHDPNKMEAAMGHISFGIANWDTEKMRQEFIKRDVCYTIEGKREPRPDMTGNLQSFHVPDAMGWDLQIGNKTGPQEWNGKSSE